MECKKCRFYTDFYRPCNNDRSLDGRNPNEDLYCRHAKPIVSSEIWIARQKNDDLIMYLCEPTLVGKCWRSGPGVPLFPDGRLVHKLPEYFYPEVTFENSPQRLIISPEQ